MVVDTATDVELIMHVVCLMTVYVACS